MKLEKRRDLKILDFDIENRPLTYLGMDYTTAEITAIAWSWVGEDGVQVRLLGVDEPERMLFDFKRAYDDADVVTGHYIRKHDLPLINGAMLEIYGSRLGEKAVQDTKVDLMSTKYLSASQESLASMFGLTQEKEHMTQGDWRSANRLTPEGIKRTSERVVNDVIQHKALRERLIDAGALGSPRIWRP